MAEVKNCELCKDLFVTDDVNEKYCKKCRLELEIDYKKIRDFLYTHPGANVMEIVNATGVSHKNVLILMKESRFNSPT